MTLAEAPVSASRGSSPGCGSGASGRTTWPRLWRRSLRFRASSWSRWGSRRSRCSSRASGWRSRCRTTCSSRGGTRCWSIRAAPTQAAQESLDSAAARRARMQLQNLTRMRPGDARRAVVERHDRRVPHRPHAVPDRAAGLHLGRLEEDLISPGLRDGGALRRREPQWWQSGRARRADSAARCPGSSSASSCRARRRRLRAVPRATTSAARSRPSGSSRRPCGSSA